MLRAAIVSLLLCSTSAAAQTTRADSAAIASIEQAGDAAVVRRDSVALDSLWAADLIFRHSDGEVEGRSDWFGKLRTGTPPFLLRETDSLTVKLHGDVAIATGRLHVRTAEPDEYWVRYVRVYARRKGRWQLVHHHSISLSESAPAGT